MKRLALSLALLSLAPGLARGQIAPIPAPAPAQAQAQGNSALPAPPPTSPIPAAKTPSSDDKDFHLPDAAKVPSQSPPEKATACVDSWPEERARPQFKETFPTRGVSGHVSFLEIEITHLPGENVFPAGISLVTQSGKIALLENASFFLPDEHSEVKPSLKRTVEGSQAHSLVKLPFIALPKEAGRFALTLPSLPISIARASGQVHTICTKPHALLVEDPLASAGEVKPHPDPEPRVQIEVWENLRNILGSLLVALPIALALAWLVLFLRKRLKKVPPPPPPRPPWETALAQLRALKKRGLIEQEKYEMFLDAVCDTLRQYLGERFGFDGLESTTRELLRQLSERASDFAEEQTVRTILQRADLVKFARRLPTEEECLDAFQQTKLLVKKTTIISVSPQSSPGVAGPRKSKNRGSSKKKKKSHSPARKSSASRSSKTPKETPS